MAYIGTLPSSSASTDLEVTQQGAFFSNYNEISSSTTITTSLSKNIFVVGNLSVTGSAILTIAGSGVFRIL